MAKLRIGVLIDDLNLPRFQAEILEELQRSDWCEIALYIKKQKSRPLYTDTRYKLFHLLEKFDAKLFGRSTPYLASTSIEAVTAESKILEVMTDERGYFDHISDGIVTTIQEAGLDVLLNFGFRYLRGEILRAARYGVWEYRHPKLPAAFWEVIESDPYTEITLERIGDATFPGYLLARYRTVTYPKSMRKNYEQISWRSHMLIVQQLRQLSKDGEAYFADKETKTYFYDLPPLVSQHQKKRLDPRFHFSDDGGKAAPTGCQSLRAFCKLIGKYAKFTFRRFFKMDRWIILFSENSADGRPNADLSTYTRIPLPSNDYFQADPFVVDEGDKSYLFYEELDYKTLKGYLLVSEYDQTSKTFGNPQEILKETYHLSYPNVFKYEDRYYMIPETHENGTVDLYEAEVFPTKWKKVRTMLRDIKAVDATLWQKDGKWWMFVGIAPKEGFSLNDELHLYYCEDFRTDTWQPHPLNPVVTDVTCARPAGNLIEQEGRLIRPAQNCSGVYGRGLVMCEILELTPTTYKERLMQQIRADFAEDLVAVHTFNHSKRFSVIDAIKSR